MRSSTLFLLLTVFLVALAISVSAYPEEEKEEGKGEEGKKEEGKEGKKEEKKEGEKGEEGKGEKGAATSLFSSSGLSTVFSLAVASLILSIH